MHKSNDPKNYANNFLECDCENPIVFAIDVTGSMGDWAKVN